jgi:hypothetical protein
VIGIPRYKWSILSGAITIVHILAIYGVTEYFYRRGIYLQGTPIDFTLGKFHVISILLSSVVAVVGIVKERPPVFGALALLFSILSFVFYVG